jgi:aminomethyltransferase
MTLVRATPFHVRTGALNRNNSWSSRNGATLATCYSDAGDEALAARSRVVLADISWRWRIAFEGERTSDFLSRLLTRDPAKLSPGTAFKALWLSDGGGVRGAGALARYGRDAFQLVSSAPDGDWIARAAAQFRVTVRDVSEQEGGVAIVGPYARAMLQAAGLNADLEPLAFRKLFWRGLDVTLSRWGEHAGYELWCRADDCLAVWDRLMRAGVPFGAQAAGLAAMDLLDVEAGIARPQRDWQPARDGLAGAPSPASLSLESLIDESHEKFNGRTAWLNVREPEPQKLVGIEFDSEIPAPHAPLLSDVQIVGRTFSSFYSPALRRAIALAQVRIASAKPHTKLSISLPPSFERPELRGAVVHVVELPFLPAPEPP